MTISLLSDCSRPPTSSTTSGALNEAIEPALRRSAPRKPIRRRGATLRTPTTPSPNVMSVTGTFVAAIPTTPYPSSMTRMVLAAPRRLPTIRIAATRSYRPRPFRIALDVVAGIAIATPNASSAITRVATSRSVGGMPKSGGRIRPATTPRPAITMPMST